VHQRPGIVHYLFDYSPDMEYLEIVSPADFKTGDLNTRPPFRRNEINGLGHNKKNKTVELAPDWHRTGALA
jgi:hypothetical protein